MNAAQTSWYHTKLPLLTPVYNLATEKSLAANDRNSALMGMGFGVCNRIWGSSDASDIESFIMYTKETIDWESDLRAGVILTAAQQFVRALQGKTKYDNPKAILSDANHHTSTYLEQATAKATSAGRIVSTYAQFHVPALFLFGHIDEAIALGEQALLPSLSVYLSVRAHTHARAYLSLAYLARAFTSPSKVTEANIAFAVESLEKHRVAASVSDINLRPWIALLDALLLERDDKIDAAVHSFETALDHSDLHSMHYETALVSEHYAEFLIRRGANRLARNSFRDSISAYKRISYFGKANQVAKKHEWLLTGTNGLNVSDASTQTFHSGPAKAHDDIRFEDPGAVDNYADKSPGVRSDPTQMPMILGASASKADLQNLGLDVVDISNLLQSTQIMAGTLEIDELLSKMAHIMLSSAGAELATITVRDGENGWKLAAMCDSSGETYLSGESLSACDDMIGRHITAFTLKFKETVYVGNVYEDERFADVVDSYRLQHPEGKSVYCSPILRGEKLLGAIYLETAPYTFTHRNIAVLQSLLASIRLVKTPSTLCESWPLTFALIVSQSAMHICSKRFKRLMRRTKR